MRVFAIAVLVPSLLSVATFCRAQEQVFRGGSGTMDYMEEDLRCPLFDCCNEDCCGPGTIWVEDDADFFRCQCVRDGGGAIMPHNLITSLDAPKPAVNQRAARLVRPGTPPSLLASPLVSSILPPTLLESTR